MEKVKLNRHFISDIYFYQEGPGVRKWQFTESGVKLINVGNINNGKIDLSSTKINISDEEAYGKYSHFLIDEGDLLIACSGIVVENFHNKIAFINKEHLPLCLNTSTMRFKELSEKKGDLNFLKYFLQTNDFKSQLGKLITGSAQLNFGPSHIRKIEIPIPPLATQQRIAAILDQADAIIQNNRAIVQKCDALTQSLFLDMFGERNPERNNWDEVKIENIVKNEKGSMRSGPFGSDLLHSEFVEKGIPVLGIDNAVLNKFQWKQRRYITEEKYQKLKRYTVYPNDIIITIMGTVGRVAVVPDNIGIAINSKHLAAISLNQKIANPDFIAFSLHSDRNILSQINQKGKGAIMTGLNLTIIKELKLKLPPISLQTQFVERVAVIEAQKHQAQLELAKSEALFQSLLQRAFKGELDN